MEFFWFAIIFIGGTIGIVALFFGIAIFLKKAEHWFNERDEHWYKIYENRKEEEKILKEKQREEFEQIFNTACKKFLEENGYLKVLVRKEKQLIMKDDYGDYIFDYWFKELKRFVAGKMQSFVYEWFIRSPSGMFVNEAEVVLFVKQNNSGHYIKRKH